MKAEEFYEQNGYTVQRTRDLSIVITELDAIELLEQYAELRIQQEREKWKEEVIKAYHQGRIAQSLDTLNGNIVKSFDEIDEIEPFKEGTEYYETEVKPNYK